MTRQDPTAARLPPSRPSAMSIRMAPPDGSDAVLTVTFFGVATLLVDDGDSALMTDGFFSGPASLPVGLGALPLRDGRAAGRTAPASAGNHLGSSGLRRRPDDNLAHVDIGRVVDRKRYR